jgi:hypothetical protein
MFEWFLILETTVKEMTAHLPLEMVLKRALHMIREANSETRTLKSIKQTMMNISTK